MDFLQVSTDIPSVSPDVVFSIFGIGITNSLIAGIIGAILLAWFAFSVKSAFANANDASAKVTRFQVFVIMLVEYIQGFFGRIIGNEDLSKRILPLIGSLFLFISVANILTLVPFLEAIQFNGVPLIRTFSSDINMTFGLGAGMVLGAHYLSIEKNGILRHVDKYIKLSALYNGFRQGIGAGMMSIVDFLIGLLDIISEIAKSFSISLRLFGNVFAGNVLMTVFLSMFAIILPALWGGMSAFTGIIQAIVFAALAASYFAQQVSD